MGTLENYLSAIFPICQNLARQQIDKYADEIGNRFNSGARFKAFVTDYKIQRIRGFRATKFYEQTYDPNIEQFLEQHRLDPPRQCVDNYVAEMHRLTGSQREFTSFASKVLFISLPEHIPIYDHFAFQGFRLLWSLLKPTNPRPPDWRISFFDSYVETMQQCDRLLNGALTSLDDAILRRKSFDILLVTFGGSEEIYQPIRSTRYRTRNAVE